MLASIKPNVSVMSVPTEVKTDKRSMSASKSFALGINNRKLYQDGDIIFFEGDEPSFVYVILRGSVKLFKAIPTGGMVDLTTLQAKQMFGEFAILDNVKGRNASAMAVGQTELLLISRDQFKKKFNALDPFTKFWIMYLKDNVLDLSNRLAKQNKYEDF